MYKILSFSSKEDLEKELNEKYQFGWTIVNLCVTPNKIIGFYHSKDNAEMLWTVILTSVDVVT